MYKSGDRLLLDKKLLDEVRQAYGSDGPYVISNILEAWESTGKEAYKHANDTLQIAKDLSHIVKVDRRYTRSRGFMQDAVAIFEDLASSGATTASGTMYELAWASKHASEIERLALPTGRRLKMRPGRPNRAIGR